MTREFKIGVRGESFTNEDGSSRQDIIRTLRAGMPVQLAADPHNPHDRRAVKVLTASGQQIGFLPSDARDAATVLKGEPISARIHALIGGTNWFQRLLGKKYIGVILRVTKGEPDWARRRALEAIASPIDAAVYAAIELSKSGDPDAAIHALRDVITRIRQLTITDPYASAHRNAAAPVSQLSLLLERQKLYAEALAVIDEWQTTFDPMQPNTATADTIRKRAERLRAKLKRV